MLTKILSNFSEDELLSFLPKNSIHFALQLDAKDNQITENNSYNKNKLAGIVASVKQVDFIFDSQLRNKLIDRLSATQLADLFPSFELEAKNVTPKYYDAIISWANDNPEKFAELLGLSALYESKLEQDSGLESISCIEPNYGLYPYQQGISKQVFSQLEQNKKRVLIHLPTGAGKTRTAMNIAAEHLRQSENNLVLWLADREELCSQAYSEFSKAWQSLGNRATSLYGFYSSSTESLSGIDSGFVVAGLHKFLSLRKSDSRQLQLLYSKLAEKVTLVIFDEAHKASGNYAYCQVN